MAVVFVTGRGDLRGACPSHTYGSGTGENHGTTTFQAVSFCSVVRVEPRVGSDLAVHWTETFTTARSTLL